MKKFAIAFATVLTLTGASFAGALDADQSATPATQAEQSVKVDVTHTSSTHHADGQKKFGADVDPSFLANMQ